MAFALFFSDIIQTKFISLQTPKFSPVVGLVTFAGYVTVLILPYTSGLSYEIDLGTIIYVYLYPKPRCTLSLIELVYFSLEKYAYHHQHKV